MSTSPYEVTSASVPVRMRDGTILSAHVHRPDAPGRFPAILEYTPYRKGPLRSAAAHPIVRHGYVSIVYDIRGTGDSAGWNDSIYSEAERQDGYDMVEWTARQPWCSGDVGMWGISFGAVAALQMAAAAPPHLKAIIARSGTDDPYTEWTNPGGSPRPYMYANYAANMTASNYLPPDPAVVGDRWAGAWAERLEHNVPWGIPFIEHLADGPFWRARSLRGNYDRVRCAVFVVGGWSDWYATPLLRTFANLDVPKRALIGPWSHQWPDAGIPGPRIDWIDEALKWFDHWLKGIDTGVMDEPPATLFVRDYAAPAPLLLEVPGAFRSEAEWPPERAQATPFYFLAGGRLSVEPPSSTDGDADTLDYDPRVGVTTGMHGGGPFNVNWAMPLDQREDEIHSLTYTTEELRDGIEVTGTPRAILNFSSTARITLFAVKLCDVAPDGTSSLVTKGFLNVAHRDSDASPSYIQPNKPYWVEVELLSCAYRFRKGHRIRIDIASADFLNVWSTPEPCTNTIYRSARTASHVVLPIVPPRTPSLPPPRLAVGHQPMPTREDLKAPKYEITRDLIGDAITMNYEVSYSPSWTNVASLRTSAKDPSCTVVVATARRSETFGARDVSVEAQCVTSSDEAAFHHTVHVAISLNARPYFSKRWAVSVPRRFV